MGCACDTYGDEEKCKEDFVWKFEEKNILEDQEIDRCYRTSLGGFYCRPNSHRKLLCTNLRVSFNCGHNSFYVAKFKIFLLLNYSARLRKSQEMAVL